MPRYTPDPSKIASGFPVFPKGTFRLEVGEPKAFANKDKQNPNVVKNYGVFTPSKCVSSIDVPTMVGKNFGRINFWQHSEGGETYSKSVLNAILGCKNDDEFAEKYGAEDWSFNTDDGSCGSGWHLVKGKVVDVVCGDPTIIEEGANKGGLQTNVERFLIA